MLLGSAYSTLSTMSSRVNAAMPSWRLEKMCFCREILDFILPNIKMKTMQKDVKMTIITALLILLFTSIWALFTKIPKTHKKKQVEKFMDCGDGMCPLVPP